MTNKEIKTKCNNYSNWIIFIDAFIYLKCIISSRIVYSYFSAYRVKPILSLPGKLLFDMNTWVLNADLQQIHSFQTLTVVALCWLRFLVPAFFSHLPYHHQSTRPQCNVAGKIEWATFPGRLIISRILSACSLWWGLTEGLTGENDVLFSAGITVQVPPQTINTDRKCI